MSLAQEEEGQEKGKRLQQGDGEVWEQVSMDVPYRVGGEYGRVQGHGVCEKTTQNWADKVSTPELL